jgi:hypothetical protein
MTARRKFSLRKKNRRLRLASAGGDFRFDLFS